MRVTDIPYSGETYEIVTCANCSFGMTQDAPDERSIGKYYNYDNYMSHADGDISVVDRLYHKVRDWMFDTKLRWIQNHTDGKAILDLGAGTGYFVKYMSSRGYQVLGIEPEEGARKTAEEKLGLLLEPLNRIETLAAQTLDVITMWHVLEHVHTIDDYFKKIARVLKKDGALFIAVPNYTSITKKAYETYWNGWDVPKHLWHFSPASMDALAQKQGFEVIKKYALPFDPFYISMLSQRNKSNNFWQIRGFLKGLWIFMQEKGNVDKACSVLYVLKARQK